MGKFDPLAVLVLNLFYLAHIIQVFGNHFSCLSPHVQLPHDNKHVTFALRKAVIWSSLSVLWDITPICYACDTAHECRNDTCMPRRAWPCVLNSAAPLSGVVRLCPAPNQGNLLERGGWGFESVQKCS